MKFLGITDGISSGAAISMNLHDSGSISDAVSFALRK